MATLTATIGDAWTLRVNVIQRARMKRSRDPARPAGRLDYEALESRFIAPSKRLGADAKFSLHCYRCGLRVLIADSKLRGVAKAACAVGSVATAVVHPDGVIKLVEIHRIGFTNPAAHTARGSVE
jgi:hypothetical protein